MLMKHYSLQLKGNIEDGGKRTIFIVNTVALAKQQHSYIKKSTAFKAGIYTGDLNVDNWKNDKWLNEFNNNQIIVATCQIILDCVRHNYLKISNINLIIFDECHNAQGEHVMKQLMELINSTVKHEQPRVCGLTGILLKKTVNPEMVISAIQHLEQIYQSTVVTVQNLNEYHNVLLYSTHPNEIIIKFDTMSAPEIITVITGYVNEQMEIIRKWNLPKNAQEVDSKTLRILNVAKSAKPLLNLFNDFLYQLNDFGVYGGSIAILSVLIELELKRRSGEILFYRNLISSCITKTELIRHMLVKHMRDNDADDDDDDSDDNENGIESGNKNQVAQLNKERYKIYTFSTPKVIRCLNKLKDYCSNTDLSKLKCLVFVERRYTAKCLFYVIKNYFKYDDEKNILPDFMVGVNNSIPESIESILEFKWNSNTLNKFKNGEINLIVASSVLEEGIDLQECNLVISYDKPKTFCSYVQTKGRARMDHSEYTILVDSNDMLKFITAIQMYRKIDKIMKEFLICKTIDRPDPMLYNEVLDLKNYTPFFSKEGAILDMRAAIQLLNRYCQQLPTDNQKNSLLFWDIVETGNINHKVVKLRLPKQSKLKDDIYSLPMPNIASAKQSAAFQACIKLYKANEFDEHFLPISNKKITVMYTDKYFKHWSNTDILSKLNTINNELIGTKKNSNNYKQIYPEQLNNCLPKKMKPLYLYKIEMNTNIPNINDQNEIRFKFTNIFNTDSMYGILTTKQLPKLPTIKLFLKYIDDIDINMNLINKKLILTSDNDLIRLKKFHTMLFTDIIQIKHNFLVNDYTDENQSYLIVPLTNLNNIDWELIKEFQQLPILHTMDIAERKQLSLKNIKNDYLNKIIHPWYRFDTKSRYMVINVLEHMTPLSPFPNKEYKNYKDYFSKKYNIHSVNDNQCLIEVKGISNNLKCLKPEVLTNIDKKFTKEIFIPEFCNNLLYPGGMWLKSLLLPSVLHRLTYLLHAYNLRKDIIDYLKVKDLIIDNVGEQVTDTSLMKPLIVEKYLLNDKGNQNDEDEGYNKHTSKSQRMPLDTTIENIKKFSITNLKNNFEQDKYPWKLSEEPVDIQRTWDSIYPIELDYYMKFTKQFSNMDINIESNLQALEVRKIQHNQMHLMQIRDDELDKKININILELDDNVVKGIKYKFEQSDLLSTITTVKSNDLFNMERFELLGDTFLKFSISVYLLHYHIDFHEGHLSELKGKFVSNKNLLILGIIKNIPSIIKNINFNPNTDWKPPLYNVPPKLREVYNRYNLSPRSLLRVIMSEEEITDGDISDENLEKFIRSNIDDKNSENNTTTMFNFFDIQILNDKTISDSVESILGICLNSFGINRTFNMLCYFGIVPNDPDIANLLNKFIMNPCLHDNYNINEIDEHLINYHDLETSLGYQFKNRGYLLQALTHSSYQLNRLTNCYQQFEFLGDAIIDLLITSFIFEKCETKDPGQLTDLRASLVNNTTLACICVRLNFNKFILLSNYTISELIKDFVEYQEKNCHKITDNVELLLNDDKLNIGEYICVPKILGDIFESIIGAVFLDTNKDLKKTWQILYNLMSEEINQFIANTPIQVIRRLYEYPGANPKFSDPIITDGKTMIGVHFTCRNEIIEVYGFGQNKDDAKKSAAKMALVKLNIS